MVGDEDIHAARVAVVNGIVGGDARIAGDEEFDAAIEDRRERIDVDAVAFPAANGDVVDDIRGKGLERLHQQGSGGLPIHVEVTPDADAFAPAGSQQDSFGQLCDVWELGGRRRFRMKERFDFFGTADPASEENLLDERGQVSAARVEQGSGQAILDAAALRAVRSLHSLPADAPRETLLPVRFRLK